MNSKLINLSILVLFVAYSCIPEVNAIRCYTCDSRNDKKCLTGSVGNNEEETCPAFVKSCVKVFGKLNNEEYVARGCNLVNQCAISGISASLSNFNYQVNCDNCESDLCNSSDSLIKSKQIGLFGVIVAFMIQKLLF